jgi:hypothetical protein
MENRREYRQVETLIDNYTYTKSAASIPGAAFFILVAQIIPCNFFLFAAIGNP